MASCTDASSDAAQASSSSIFDSVSSAFASLFPTAHADDGDDDEEEEGGGDKEEDGDEKEEGGDDKEGGDEEEGGEDEDEDDDEPEDPLPHLIEQCEESKECAPAKHHFLECQERVEAGNGFKGETCVEEFFHLVHCTSNCSAPRLFKQLK